MIKDDELENEERNVEMDDGNMDANEKLILTEIIFGRRFSRNTFIYEWKEDWTPQRTDGGELENEIGQEGDGRETKNFSKCL